MKRIIAILFLILLVGCDDKTKNEIVKDEGLVLSKLYNKKIVELYNQNYERELIVNNRLDAINREEIEEIVFVTMEGKERTITDKDELAKFKEYIKDLKVYGGMQNNPGKFMGLGIKVKDKEMVLLNIFENHFCLANLFCSQFTKEENIIQFLLTLKGEEREVLPFSYYDLSVNAKSWADAYYNEDEFQENTNDFILLDNKVSDSWSSALNMALFIDESFNNYTDIENQDKLTAGIISQSLGYTKFVESASNYYVNEWNDELHLKKPVTQMKNFALLFYYRIIPENALEIKGKELFGESYKIPKLGTKVLMGTNERKVESFQDQHYYIQHLLYEGTSSYDNAYILDMKETGKQRVYRIAKFTEGFFVDASGKFTSIITNSDGKNFIVDSYNKNLIKGKVIEGNIAEFDQWEYTLQMENNHVQIVSATFIPKTDKKYTNLKIDESKGYFYEEDGYGIINMDSKDAQIMNHNIALQGKDCWKYIANENQGLLSVVAHMNIQYFSGTEIHVFDIQTGKLLSDHEIVERLNIDMDKLKKSLVEIIPMCFEKACGSLNEWSKSNYVFIGRDNKFGYLERMSNQLILFDWEEVQ